MRRPLKDRVRELPLVPGVYLLKDAGGKILYIGKARVLRNRVSSYFSRSSKLPKITVLVRQVVSVDYIETPTEVDALLLEAHLIRKFKPKFNQELKDDKTFPLLKITSETYPRLVITRNKSEPKAVYYGPFTDARLLREAVGLIHTLFPIRKCRRMPKSACLYYHIGQCLAPCIKPEIKEDYGRLMEEVRSFLGGGKKSLIEYLSERMSQAAGELRFEDARFFKEQIEALGKLRRKRFLLKKPEAGIALSATLELRKALLLGRNPEKIVCFDVSNTQGKEAVASKVSFYRELPDKLGYRRYRIRGVTGIDDYAMIREALRRMLRGIREGRENFNPDLIVIDGGKGHLRAALGVVREEGFQGVSLLSIAKRLETVYHLIGYEERKSGRIRELALMPDSAAHFLIRKVRDEAHRFAVQYHRHLRSEGLRSSVLDGIFGVGEKRKRRLLRQFDSMDELKQASIDQLAAVPGMSRAAAVRIRQYFQGAAGNFAERDSHE